MANASKWLDDSNSLFPVTERRCGSCREVRPLSMFYIEAEARAAARRGSRTLGPCRICVQAKNTERLARIYAVLDPIKVASGCVDCGLVDVDHPEIYDFDHLPEFEKVSSVAGMYHTHTIEQILEEVAKCEVRCANCHRIMTRRGRPASSFGQNRGPNRA